MIPIKVVVLSVFLLISIENATSRRTSELKREILDQILPKNTNEILVAPGNMTNGATAVEIFMHILNIDKINEEKAELTFRFLLRQTWKDDRLKYDSHNGQIKKIVINDPDAIWTPDSFFSNEKKGHHYDITHQNVFIRIHPDGSVLHSRRLSITADCPMNLQNFPFDNQACKLRMELYGSTYDEVTLSWRDLAPVTFTKSMRVPLFDLTHVRTDAEVVKLITGNYSILSLTFLLSRRINYYIYHTFIPCTMLVILSWVPFWLNKKHLASRFLISTAALITWMLIVNDQNKLGPKLSYVTCMDCFTGTCLTFIFISIIETALVHILHEHEDANKESASAANGHLHHNEENKTIASIKAWIVKIPSRTYHIDVGARILIPLIFCIFCIIYFATSGNTLDAGNSVLDPRNHTNAAFKSSAIRVQS